ncbi:MAG: asparagine synthase (glutamine-hydrolyzing) [Defluviitaleaceae bacterium]|nr:asparagine synthase (glutamine-hydrolyzing) [Defluviitaleaceae bacterium]
MCGFCGFTTSLNNDNQSQRAILENMTKTIAHRGPDSEGFHTSNFLQIGFRRLSFLGLADGDQPIYNETGNLGIVFNGEIYNYTELRENLLNLGHTFKTNADTEVILHAYEEYGKECLNKLRGMFSFVIFNIETGNIFAARDFFGIKPFYYTLANGELIFASEIKAILAHGVKKEVNEQALAVYLSFQYSALEETLFKGIYKLMPGHYLEFENKKLSITKYFNISFDHSGDINEHSGVNIEDSFNQNHYSVENETEEPRLNVDNTTSKINQTLLNSINHHSEAEVEIGSFLSSGVDSSYIASRFNGKKTFTVGFDYEEFNEISYAERLSKEKGLTNYSKIITTEEYWQSLSKIQYHMDEPLADPSAVALYFVSGLAKEHVKGVLSGEGADELFGGYNIYQEPLALAKFQKIPKPIRVIMASTVSALPFKFKGKNFLIRASKTIEQRFIGNAKIFSEKEVKKILSPAVKSALNNSIELNTSAESVPNSTTQAQSLASQQDIMRPASYLSPQQVVAKYYEEAKNYDDITKMQFLDLHMWLVGDILLKADKMSMAHSLEVRVPFLDKEVYNLARTLQTKDRVTKTKTKKAFREAAEKHLPKENAEKKKLGFPVPIRHWLRQEEYYEKVKEAFASETANKFFNRAELIKLLEDHKKKTDNSRKIWTIYMFLIWHNEFFRVD